VRASSAGQTAAPMPWADAMASRWGNVVGDVPERASIMATMARALAPSTAAAYGGHWARFVRWCEAQPDQPDPLPATTGTVLRWLAGDVTVGHKVRDSSLQPYLSALNGVHKDLDYPEPALGHLIRRFRAGLGHQQGDDGRDARRTYLPPHVVSAVFDWALALDLPSASTAEWRAFRAAVCTVFTTIFFARGDTGAGLLSQHVRRSVAGITVTFAREKGKARNWDSRTMVIPPGSVPGLEQLLAKWELARGPVLGDRSYYLLPGERTRGAFPPKQVDVWLREILDHLRVAPPPGELWSGHSLRKGAASGANSIGVTLVIICFAGGWAVASKAVHDYVDPTCPASAAARRLFGWLLPG
jgi:hypothetical protein